MELPNVPAQVAGKNPFKGLVGRFGVVPVVAVGGVLVLAALWWFYHPAALKPNYVLTSDIQPAFSGTYPEKIFTAKPPARAVINSNPDTVATSTFRGIDVKDIKDFAQVEGQKADAASKKLVADRQFLAQHGYSWTPEGFLSAARKGDVSAVTAYLRAGMSADTRNAFSSTALHAAAEENQIEVAKLLLAVGANVNVATTNLQTPLHRAVAQNFPGMAQLLLAMGADAKAATLEGWTPLFYAVDNNNQALMESLINAGANTNVKDRFGNTPLMIAVRKNYLGLSKRLLFLGAQINSADLSGRTPLHYSVSKGYYQLTKMLLENGAKVDVRDRRGQLPMDIALANQDLALANLLLANGSRRPQVLGLEKKGGARAPVQDQKAKGASAKAAEGR